MNGSQLEDQHVVFGLYFLIALPPEHCFLWRMRMCVRLFCGQIYYEVNTEVTILSWFRPGEFEMHAAFTPLVTKEDATTACNRALRWIKREEESLFQLASLTF